MPRIRKQRYRMGLEARNYLRENKRQVEHGCEREPPACNSRWRMMVAMRMVVVTVVTVSMRVSVMMAVFVHR
jgi:hypothetical protein